MRFMATLCEGESVLMRNTVLLMLAAGCLRSVAAAQSTVEPGCDRPNSNAVACALRAGRVADLRDPVYASDERELRFWSSQDMLEPIALLVIQQRGNTVTGRLLLIWSDSTLGDSVSTAMCTTEVWRTPAGSLCTGKLPGRPDWARLLRTLDSLGLTQLPVSPVRESACPVRPNEPPTLAGCQFVDHGPSRAIEVRTAGMYWHYDFPRVPDSKSPGIGRDVAIVRTLECAMQRWTRC